MLAGFDSNAMRAGLDSGKGIDTPFSQLDFKVKQKLGESFTANYSLTGSLFANAESETNLRQTATLEIENKSGLKGFLATVFVFGTREAVDFVNGRNSWATVQARERRQQWQHRASLSQMWEGEKVFVRPVAGLIYYDLNSRVKPGRTGYDNWVDRYDLYGGVDVGRTVGTGGELYLGWRRGRQYQDDEGGRPSSRSNRYNRVFLGLRNRQSSAIGVTMKLGPSFHRYDDPDSIGGPSIDSWYFGIQLRGEVFSHSSWEAEVRLDRGVASTGLLSSETRNFAVRCQWPVSERSQFRFSSSAKALVYDGRPIADWVYESAINWDFTRNVGCTLNLGLIREAGRDQAPPKNPGRDFERWLLVASWKQSF